MKTQLLCFALVCVCFAGFAKAGNPDRPGPDTVKLKIDGTHAYYQNTIKADSIKEPMIYLRAVQFMASKNFQQNYGYEEEGKLICTTAQDLNVNPVYIGDDNDAVEQYTVQFSITLDIRNNSYRYTVNNVLFFIPTDNGNKRETLYEVYLKATNTSSKRIAKDAGKLIGSFEKYLDALTGELYEGVKQKSAIYSKF